MAVTLIYEPQEGPHGVRREAAVFKTVEEALLQAAWDEMVGSNRFPEKVVQGPHHGSDGYKPRNMRRGRGVWMDDGDRRNAHDTSAKSKVLADGKVIVAAAKVVRRHFVVHPQDVANPNIEGAFGSPMVPVEPNDAKDRPSPSVATCLAELRELVS